MRDWVTGLEYCRRKRGITQADLAHATGISPTEWCLCEMGERLASVQAYLRFSELLEVTIDQLLDRYSRSEVIDSVCKVCRLPVREIMLTKPENV